MARRFPLQAPLEHARHRLEAGERLLRILKRKEDDARRRLDDLRGYRQEYLNRYAGAGQQGMSILLMRDFQVFIAKLDTAIRHQEGEVEQIHGHWAQAHEAWLKQRQKVKAYETLGERHQRAEEKRQERREQVQTDEQANRIHFDRTVSRDRH